MENSGNIKNLDMKKNLQGSGVKNSVNKEINKSMYDSFNQEETKYDSMDDSLNEAAVSLRQRSVETEINVSRFLSDQVRVNTRKQHFTPNISSYLCDSLEDVCSLVSSAEAEIVNSVDKENLFSLFETQGSSYNDSLQNEVCHKNDQKSSNDQCFDDDSLAISEMENFDDSLNEEFSCADSGHMVLRSACKNRCKRKFLEIGNNKHVCKNSIAKNLFDTPVIFENSDGKKKQAKHKTIDKSNKKTFLSSVSDGLKDSLEEIQEMPVHAVFDEAQKSSMSKVESLIEDVSDSLNIDIKPEESNEEKTDLKFEDHGPVISTTLWNDFKKFDDSVSHEESCLEDAVGAISVAEDPIESRKVSLQRSQLDHEDKCGTDSVELLLAEKLDESVNNSLAHEEAVLDTDCLSESASFYSASSSLFDVMHATEKDERKSELKKSTVFYSSHNSLLDVKAKTTQTVDAGRPVEESLLHFRDLQLSSNEAVILASVPLHVDAVCQTSILQEEITRAVDKSGQIDDTEQQNKNVRLQLEFEIGNKRNVNVLSISSQQKVYSSNNNSPKIKENRMIFTLKQDKIELYNALDLHDSSFNQRKQSIIQSRDTIMPLNLCMKDKTVETMSFERMNNFCNEKSEAGFDKKYPGNNKNNPTVTAISRKCTSDEVEAKRSREKLFCSTKIPVRNAKVPDLKPRDGKPSPLKIPTLESSNTPQSLPNKIVPGFRHLCTVRNSISRVPKSILPVSKKYKNIQSPVAQYIRSEMSPLAVSQRYNGNVKHSKEPVNLEINKRNKRADVQNVCPT